MFTRAMLMNRSALHALVVSVVIVADVRAAVAWYNDLLERGEVTRTPDGYFDVRSAEPAAVYRDLSSSDFSWRCLEMRDVSVSRYCGGG